MKMVIPILLILGCFLLVSVTVLSKNQPLLEGGSTEIRTSLFGSSNSSSPEQESIKERKITKKEYTYNSELTEYDDGTGNAVIYSGMRFVDSTGTKIEEISSLKDCQFCDNINLIIDEDKEFPIEIIDYNFTSLKANFKVTSKNINKDIPLKIYKKGNESDIKSNQKENIINVNDDTIRIVELGFNKELKWGLNSTTIILETADVDNLRDTYVASNDGDANKGTEVGMTSRSWSIVDNRAYMMWDITPVSTGGIILNAIINLHCTTYISSLVDNNISVYHVNDSSWDGQNETTITWNNQPCGTAFNDATDCNLTASDFSKENAVNIWWDWNITSSFSYEHSRENNNLSLVFKVPLEGQSDSYGCVFKTKENVINISFINVTYLANIPPTHITPILNATSSNNVTTDNLTGFPQGLSDTENDNLTVNYKWFKNDTFIGQRWIDDDNLLLYIPSDNNITADFSGNNNIGERIGMIYNANGKINGSFDFRGSNQTNDSVDYGHFVVGYNNVDFTVGAWFKINSWPFVDVDNHDIVQMYNNHTSGRIWTLYVSNSPSVPSVRNRTRLCIYDQGLPSPAVKCATTGNLTTPNEWHFIVGVFNQTDILIYRNGVLEGNQTYTLANVNDDTKVNLTIGGTIELGSDFTNGTIDEVFLFNRSLTAGEIQKIYNVTKYGFAIMNSSETSIGNVWKIEMTPYDIFGSGIPLNSSNLTIIPFVDTTYPSFSNYNDNNESLVDEGIAKFNITLLDTNDTVGIEIGGINYTADNNNWLQFDGIDDFVNVSDSATINLTTEISISMWVYPLELQTWVQLIGKDTFSDSYSILFDAGGQIRWGLQGVSAEPLFSTVNLNTNGWQHIMTTYKSGRYKIYLNGIERGTAASTGNFDISSKDLHIGADITNSYYFNGSMDEVRIYNVSLEGHQAERMYNESSRGSDLGGVSIPVLAYHHVDDLTPETYVYLQNFTDQMDFLNSSGYTTITYEDYYNYTQGKFTLPSKPVIISFDDNYKDVFTNATPVMDKYNFTGEVIIITETPLPGNPLYMNWSDLQNLSDKGWGMQSHTVSHPHMLTQSASERTPEYSDSKDNIITNLSVTPISFTFPYNEANTTLANECSSYYKLCWTKTNAVASAGYVYKANNLTAYLSITRIPIINTTMFDDFKTIFGKDENIVLQLDFDETYGTTVIDDSGNSNDGIINGAIRNNNVFYKDIYLTSGSYFYYWWAYGNGTSNNLNISATNNYVVNTSAAAEVTCDCPASGDWEINDGSICEPESDCNIGTNKLRISDGGLLIDSGINIRAGSCYVSDGERLFIEDGGGLFCGS